MNLHTDAPAGAFRFSIRESEDAPWKSSATFPRPRDRPGKPADLGLPLGAVRDGARFAIRVESAQPGESLPLTIKGIRCEFATRETPYATGDPVYFGWGAPTDFGIYGGSYVGYLAALVERTNCEHVLRIDLLATDSSAGPSHPTFLYYNPDPRANLVQLDVGPEPRDLYDAVTKRFVARGARGVATFSVPPDGAAVIVVVPADAPTRRDGGRLLAGDTVIDWHP